MSKFQQLIDDIKSCFAKNMTKKETFDYLVDAPYTPPKGLLNQLIEQVWRKNEQMA